MLVEGSAPAEAVKQGAVIERYGLTRVRRLRSALACRHLGVGRRGRGEAGHLGKEGDQRLVVLVGLLLEEAVAPARD